MVSPWVDIASVRGGTLEVYDIMWLCGGGGVSGPVFWRLSMVCVANVAYRELGLDGSALTVFWASVAWFSF